MKNDVLNGLCEKDIIRLYVFIAKIDEIIKIYEQKRLKKDFNKIIPDKNICLVKQTDIYDHIKNNDSNKIYCVKKRNKPISFLTHLRNAIAHGSIQHDKKSDTIIFEDKVTRKNLVFYTAYGRFPKDSIDSVITFFLKQLGIKI